MKDNASMLDALSEYIQNEKDGYEFYLNAASRTVDDRGSAMFTSLAVDEREHIRRLQAEYDSLVSKGEWLSLEQLGRGENSETAAVFPKDERGVRERVKVDANDLDALEVGIQMEKDSYSVYDAARKKTNDPVVAEVFSQLADEESRHLATLEETYEYLAHPERWFQMLEKPIFEG